jgi:LacI family transcriptional regulator
VRQETVERVLKAANEAGYHRNPLTGAVMSLLRRSSGQEFRGVIAALEMVPADRPDHAVRYSEAITAGIVKRAGELGFKVEKFEMKRTAPHERLDDPAHPRHQTLVILPLRIPISQDWIGAARVHRLLHRPAGVALRVPDHYRCCWPSQRLHTLGYRRPGLIIDIQLDERLQSVGRRVVALQNTCLNTEGRHPPAHHQEAFSTWFKGTVDVVLCHEYETMTWMRRLARVPETHRICA